jgi:hypothetical protein
MGGLNSAELERYLASLDMFGGGQYPIANQYPSANQGQFPGGMNQPGFFGYSPPGQYGPQGNGVPFNGDMKLTEKNGEQHLEAINGFLYQKQPDGSKKEVGQVNPDGSLTFNSSAGDLVKEIKDSLPKHHSHWYDPSSWKVLGRNEDPNKPDSRGDVTFSSQQLDVSPDDIPANAQASQQGGSSFPVSIGPSFYSLQMASAVQPMQMLQFPQSNDSEEI